MDLQASGNSCSAGALLLYCPFDARVLQSAQTSNLPGMVALRQGRQATVLLAAGTATGLNSDLPELVQML